jgi:hypothetical protein
MEQETFNITSNQHVSVNTLVNNKTLSHKQINNPPTQPTRSSEKSTESDKATKKTQIIPFQL